MKAMILAAGLGTRLRPLTDTRPKALVEINGRTLLEITLTRLRAFGVSEAIINVHHFTGMVIDYLKSHDNFGMRIEISREDDLLLDTGGGLKKAGWFFLEDSRHASDSQPAASRAKSVIPNEVRDRGKASTQSKADQSPRASASSDEPFLLHNVDVLSTIDLQRMVQFHNEHNALATLAVQSRKSSRLLLFNDLLQLVGRAAPGEEASSAAGRAVIPSEARTSAASRGFGAMNPGKASVKLRDDETSPALASEALLPLAFSGIHIISRRLLSMLAEEGVFSIIDSYLRLAAQGEKILGFRADEYYWRDLGRPADLTQAALDLGQEDVL